MQSQNLLNDSSSLTAVYIFLKNINVNQMCASDMEIYPFYNLGESIQQK